MSKKNVLVFRELLPEDQLARLQAAHHVVVADPRKEPEAFAAALPPRTG
jgi:phosphogluconate 2-dehydrogenase